MSNQRKKINPEEYDPVTEPSINPMILDPDDLKDVSINFEHLNHSEKRSLARVVCPGFLVLYHNDGKYVTKGVLRDINDNGGGFELKTAPIRVGQELLLEFSGPPKLAMSRVHVRIKTIRPLEGTDQNIRVGVEFMNKTPAFQRKISELMAFIKTDKSGFGSNEVI
jgi:hypothetical protein